MSMVGAHRNSCLLSARTGSPARALSRRISACGRGQAMVEFALIAIVAIFILVLGIQYALVGQAALALSQAAYQGARYASVNPNAAQGDVQCFLAGTGTTSGGTACSQQGVASPTLTTGDSAYLTVSLNPTTTPRSFGQQVSVTVNFDLCKSGMLILGSTGGTCGSFLGISFPTSLSATETAMGE